MASTAWGTASRTASAPRRAPGTASRAPPPTASRPARHPRRRRRMRRMRRKSAQYGPVRGRRRGLAGVDQLQPQPGRQGRRPGTRASVRDGAPVRSRTRARIRTRAPARTGTPVPIRTRARIRTRTGTPAPIPSHHPFRPHPRLDAVRCADPQRRGAAVGPYATEFGRVGVGGLVPVRQQLAPWRPRAADRTGADLYPAAEVGGGLVPDDADERERPYARRGDAPVGRGRSRGRSVAAGCGHAPVEPVRREGKERQRLRGAGGGDRRGPGVGGAGVDGERQGEGGGARDADRGCQVCTHD